jgi:hypothetical protein
LFEVPLQTVASKSTKKSHEHRCISVRANSYRSIIFTQALSVTAAVLLAVVLVSADTVSYGPPSRSEAAPYLPSGWRPSGRQFLLPVRQNYDFYLPSAVYGAPTTTQQSTTTEQVTSTTEVPTTTEVRHCHKLSAAPVFRDRTPCRIEYRYQSAWCPSYKTETFINNALENFKTRMKPNSPFSFRNLLGSNNPVWSDHKATLKTTARIPIDTCGNYGVNIHVDLSTLRNIPRICRSVHHTFQSSKCLQALAIAKNNYSLLTTLLTDSLTFLSTM